MDDLKFLREFVQKFTSKQDAARVLGISSTTLSQYLHGSMPIGAKMRERMRDAGVYEQRKGEINGEIREPKENYAKSLTPPNAQILTDDEIVWLPLYERRVNAGVGVDLDVRGVLRFPELRSRIQHIEKTFAVMISGDSMQLAGINENSIAICERVDNADPDKLVNKIVLAGYDGAAYIKRLVKEDGKYLLRSESTRHYDDLELSDMHDNKVFAVVLHINTRF